VDALKKSLAKYWDKETKSFIVQEKDKFWLDLLLYRMYKEIENNPESKKDFGFWGE
jgi:hypothetical protein